MFIKILNYETNKSMSLNLYNLSECYSRNNNINPDDQVHPYLVVYKTQVGVLYYEGYADKASADARVRAIMSTGYLPNYQTKTVNPTTSQQTVLPDDNYDALSDVTVNAVTSAIDSNIKAENIKKNVSILGVTGTLEGGGGGDNIEDYFVMHPVKQGFLDIVNMEKLVKKVPVLDLSGLNGDMSGLFQNCSVLTTIPLLDTSSVTNMMSTFAYCSALTTLPLLDTSSVTNTSYMFNGCTSLTTLPLLDTSSVTNMNSMFNGCRSLTTIPQLNTSKVTNMSYMFSGCTSLTTLPLLDTSSVTNTSYMFNGCTSLVTTPQLNTSSVTDMSFMYQNCTSLTTVSEFTVASSAKMGAIFSGCTSLTTFPVLDISGVGNFNNIAGMFGRCTSLTDESLDNILQMCANSHISYSSKSLFNLGIQDTSIYPVSRIEALPHYQDFIDAGWTIGYF